MSEREIRNIADAVRIIDELVTNEMERLDYTNSDYTIEDLQKNEDLQKAWNIVKNRAL